jgi:hypothetical protein
MKLRSMLAVVTLIGTRVIHAQGVTHPPHVDSTLVKERRPVEMGIRGISRNIVELAQAMPATKYGFAPTEGAFRGVRTFREQLKHLAATNYILAAAAVGHEAPPHAGDEVGADSVQTKDDIVAYVSGSFRALEDAAKEIGNPMIPVGSSPISPFQGGTATRIALIVEALAHAYDHYGQLVVYARMNGVVPPASIR